ncbi:oligosaccharide flippase family protein [Rubellimicrobium roseum]|nr:oligosaccharide flippase family protein [Rubellimicrobium roseum]
MLRSALLILSGNAAASILLLARNLLIARLIPVADYGVAATFAIAMSVVEMVSAFGLQQQIIQAKNGDDPHFQAVLQGFQIMRGVASGLLLFALAGPIADLLNVPEAAWGHRVMALVPVLNALAHFDIHRLNRQNRFGPMIVSSTVPALASLLAVWPLVAWLEDWRAMLFVILIQAVLTTAVSHLVAERPYRIALDRKIMAGSLRFGWPLLLNNVLLFLVFNGDRIIVGRVLGMEALAIFSMGVTLTLTPTLVMAKSLQNFFLPRLSQAAHALEDGAGRPRFVDLSQATFQGALLNGSLLVLAVLIAGGPFVLLALGPKYADLVPLLNLMAVLQAVRVAKAGSSIVALALGRTGNAAIANLMRLLSLPIAWLALLQGEGLVAVLWIGIAGEALGYAVSLQLVRRRLHLPLRPMLGPLLATGLLLMTAIVANSFEAIPFWAAEIAAALFFALQIVSMKELRQRISAALQRKPR